MQKQLLHDRQHFQLGCIKQVLATRGYTVAFCEARDRFVVHWNIDDTILSEFYWDEGWVVVPTDPSQNWLHALIQGTLPLINKMTNDAGV